MLCDRVMSLQFTEFLTEQKAFTRERIESAERFWQATAYVQAMLPSAQRFFIEDNAVAAADSVRASHAKHLMDAEDFARLPFPICWFEWNPSVLADSAWSAPGDLPKKVGILAAQEGDSPLRAKLFLCWELGRETCVCPYSYEYSYCDSSPEFTPSAALIEEASRSRTIVPKGFIRDEVDKIAWIRLSAQTRLLAHPGWKRDPREDRFSQWGSELMFYKSLLILLNTRNGTETKDGSDLTKLNKARSRSGKPPLLSHRIVSLREALSQRYSGSGNSERGRVRVHRVRGHYKRRRTGLFWWSDFVRGNPQAGMVTHDYRMAS